MCSYAASLIRYLLPNLGRSSCTCTGSYICLGISYYSIVFTYNKQAGQSLVAEV